MPKIPSKEILWAAAEDLKSAHEAAPPELAMMIRDADFFGEYINVLINNAPYTNAILGAIVLGWNLREKTAELECGQIITDTQNIISKRVHRA